MRKRIGDTEGRRSARVAVMSVIAGTLLANSVPLMAQAAVENGWYERGRHYQGWYYYREAIKSAVVEVKNATNLKGLLGSLYNLESADLSRLDTSQVTDMSDMFRGCAELAELDLSNFDTSKVTDMSWMFNSCDNLTELNLSSFDTSQVTNMTGMFNCSPKLQNIYVGSGWVIGEGTAAKNMFTACGTDHVTLQQ